MIRWHKARVWYLTQAHVENIVIYLNPLQAKSLSDINTLPTPLKEEEAADEVG